MDLRKPMPLIARLGIALGPLAFAIVGAIIHAEAVSAGEARNSMGDLAIYCTLIIGASLWAVFIFRRTAHQRR
jgi:hypothetical protein